MICELRIYWRLRPVLKQMEGVFKMKLSVNSVLQLLMLVLQGLNQISDLVPPKGKFWIMVGISAIQGLVAILAHFANPDGTPAEVAYIKPK